MCSSFCSAVRVRTFGSKTPQASLNRPCFSNTCCPRAMPLRTCAGSSIAVTGWLTNRVLSFFFIADYPGHDLMPAHEGSALCVAERCAVVYRGYALLFVGEQSLDDERLYARIVQPG